MPDTRAGCTLCAQRITGPGMPSYCGDLSRDASDPGRLIKPSEIASGPTWCPKRGGAA